MIIFMLEIVEDLKRNLFSKEAGTNDEFQNIQVAVSLRDVGLSEKMNKLLSENCQIQQFNLKLPDGTFA